MEWLGAGDSDVHHISGRIQMQHLQDLLKDPPLGFKGLCTSDGGLDVYLFTAYQDVFCEEMMAMKVEKCVKLVFNMKSHITRSSITV